MRGASGARSVANSCGTALATLRCAVIIETATIRRAGSGRARQTALLTTTLPVLALLTAAVLAGCDAEPITPLTPPCDGYTNGVRLTAAGVDKLDVLLVIDNSPSMADKQAILGTAVADLLAVLLNPPCVDPQTGEPAAEQPAGPTEHCLGESRRESAVFEDVHIGVISSSIGGYGSDSCTASSENDAAHLIHRSGTAPGDPAVEGYAGKSFLVWDPRLYVPTHEPPGERDLALLTDKLATMVQGAGSSGCRFEAPLEAWYRFLVDPNPHAGVGVVDGSAQLVGTDELLLKQRAEFLRPDSVLAIVVLSDENDCSIRGGGQFYFAAQQQQPSGSGAYHLPKPRAACAIDPQDSCCRSCGQGPGEGCDSSADDCDSGPLAAMDDALDVRCFDQKRRFGIDLMWPIDRYVGALTEREVADRDGNVTKNPLFRDLNPDDDVSWIRDPGMVFVATIVGVPWQDIARKNEQGEPDLLHGSNMNGQPRGGFQSATEMIVNDTWSVVLGDAASGLPPTDPLMIASIDPRSGINPITGDALAAPGSGQNNPINGSERLIAERDDLQYACIFPLPEPRDCSDPAAAPCDCSDPLADNPLCSSTTPTLQERAKAYPSPRQLELVRAVGTQGIAGSICPAQLDDASRRDWGYRAALDVLSERLQQSLSGFCMPRSLEPDADGQVSCRILEARRTPSCGCDLPGRQQLAPDDPLIRLATEDPLAATADWSCFCEMTQLGGTQRQACQNDVADAPVDEAGQPLDGWCYIDATVFPLVGNPDLVAACPDTEKRTLRFVGRGEPLPEATVFIACGSRGDCQR